MSVGSRSGAAYDYHIPSRHSEVLHPEDRKACSADHPTHLARNALAALQRDVIGDLGVGFFEFRISKVDLRKYLRGRDRSLRFRIKSPVKCLLLLTLGEVITPGPLLLSPLSWKIASRCRNLPLPILNKPGPPQRPPILQTWAAHQLYRHPAFFRSRTISPLSPTTLSSSMLAPARVL